MKTIQAEFLELLKWLRDRNVTSQVQVMIILLLQDQEKMKPTAIAQKLGVTLPSISQSVSKLQDLGIVDSVRSQVDSRVVFVSLANGFVMPSMGRGAA